MASNSGKSNPFLQASPAKPSLLSSSKPRLSSLPLAGTSPITMSSPLSSTPRAASTLANPSSRASTTTYTNTPPVSSVMTKPLPLSSTTAPNLSPALSHSSQLTTNPSQPSLAAPKLAQPRLGMLGGARATTTIPFGASSSLGAHSSLSGTPMTTVGTHTTKLAQLSTNGGHGTKLAQLSAARPLVLSGKSTLGTPSKSDDRKPEERLSSASSRSLLPNGTSGGSGIGGISNNSDGNVKGGNNIVTTEKISHGSGLSQSLALTRSLQNGKNSNQIPEQQISESNGINPDTPTAGEDGEAQIMIDTSALSGITDYFGNSENPENLDNSGLLHSSVTAIDDYMDSATTTIDVDDTNMINIVDLPDDTADNAINESLQISDVKQIKDVDSSDLNPDIANTNTNTIAAGIVADNDGAVGVGAGAGGDTAADREDIVITNMATGAAETEVEIDVEPTLDADVNTPSANDTDDNLHETVDNTCNPADYTMETHADVSEQMPEVIALDAIETAATIVDAVDSPIDMENAPENAGNAVVARVNVNGGAAAAAVDAVVNGDGDTGHISGVSGHDRGGRDKKSKKDHTGKKHARKENPPKLDASDKEIPSVAVLDTHTDVSVNSSITSDISAACADIDADMTDVAGISAVGDTAVVIASSDDAGAASGVADVVETEPVTEDKAVGVAASARSSGGDEDKDGDKGEYEGEDNSKYEGESEDRNEDQGEEQVVSVGVDEGVEQVAAGDDEEMDFESAAAATAAIATSDSSSSSSAVAPIAVASGTASSRRPVLSFLPPSHNTTHVDHASTSTRVAAAVTAGSKGPRYTFTRTDDPTDPTDDDRANAAQVDLDAHDTTVQSSSIQETRVRGLSVHDTGIVAVAGNADVNGDAEANMDADDDDGADAELDMDAAIDVDMDADSFYFGDEMDANDTNTAAAAAALSLALDEGDDDHDTEAEAEQEVDEDEEEDEEEEEEEIEPKLKYQRVGAGVTRVLKGDAVTCMSAHDKFLVLGTRSGSIRQLDLFGNEIMKVQCHTGAVNAISIDNSGDFVSTCGNDGCVCVVNLYTKEQTRLRYNKPVYAVALSPKFKEGQQALASGGALEQLVISTKGWLGFRDNVIHSGEGPVRTIAWAENGNLVAWANDVGVKVFDFSVPERVAFIARQKDAPSATTHKCRLTWARNDVLFIGWADVVKVGQIRYRNLDIIDGHAKSTVVPGNRYMQLIAMFTTDLYICGIAPLNEFIMLLGYAQDDDDDEDDDDESNNNIAKASSTGGNASGNGKMVLNGPGHPEVRIVTYTNEEVSRDALPLAQYDSCEPKDLSLAYLAGLEPLLYITSPYDIVLARCTDLDDHISWLLQRSRYREALESALGNEYLLQQHNTASIALTYLQHLVQEGRFELCAQIMGSLLNPVQSLARERVPVDILLEAQQYFTAANGGSSSSGSMVEVTATSTQPIPNARANTYNSNTITSPSTASTSSTSTSTTSSVPAGRVAQLLSQLRLARAQEGYRATWEQFIAAFIAAKQAHLLYDVVCAPPALAEHMPSHARRDLALNIPQHTAPLPLVCTHTPTLHPNTGNGSGGAVVVERSIVPLYRESYTDLLLAWVRERDYVHLSQAIASYPAHSYDAEVIAEAINAVLVGSVGVDYLNTGGNTTDSASVGMAMGSSNTSSGKVHPLVGSLGSGSGAVSGHPLAHSTREHGHTGGKSVGNDGRRSHMPSFSPSTSSVSPASSLTGVPHAKLTTTVNTSTHPLMHTHTDTDTGGVGSVLNTLAARCTEDVRQAVMTVTLRHLQAENRPQGPRHNTSTTTTNNNASSNASNNLNTITSGAATAAAGADSTGAGAGTAVSIAVSRVDWCVRQLMDALAALLLRQGKRACALRVKIDSGSDDVFTLIEDHMLFDEIRPYIELLTLYHPIPAIHLFVQHTHYLPVDGVVAQLVTTPVFLCHYLHELHKRSPTLVAPYARRLVSLYAEFAPHLLLPFLRTSKDYSLSESMRICTEWKVYDAIVYLHLRTGSAKEAVRVLLERLGAVAEVMGIVEEQKDPELWIAVIDECVKSTVQDGNSVLLTQLLDIVGQYYVDIPELLTRIPGDVVIPDLKAKLSRILHDAALQVSVRRGCNRILRSDNTKLQRQHIRGRARAITVSSHKIGLAALETSMPVVGSGSGNASGSGGAGSSGMGVVAAGMSVNSNRANSDDIVGRCMGRNKHCCVCKEPLYGKVQNTSQATAAANVALFYCGHGYHGLCLAHSAKRHGGSHSSHSTHGSGSSSANSGGGSDMEWNVSGSSRGYIYHDDSVLTCVACASQGR